MIGCVQSEIFFYRVSYSVSYLLTPYSMLHRPYIHIQMQTNLTMHIFLHRCRAVPRVSRPTNETILCALIVTNRINTHVTKVSIVFHSSNERHVISAHVLRLSSIPLSLPAASTQSCIYYLLCMQCQLEHNMAGAPSIHSLSVDKMAGALSSTSEDHPGTLL